MAANAQMQNQELMNKLFEGDALNDPLNDDFEDVLESSFGFERLSEPTMTFQKSQALEQMKSIPEVTAVTTSFPAIAQQLSNEFAKFASNTLKTSTLESVETCDSDSAIVKQTNSELAKFATDTLESVETIDSEEMNEYGDDITELPNFLKRQMSAPAPSMLPTRHMFGQGKAVQQVADSSASRHSEQHCGSKDEFESDERIDDTFNLRSLLKRQTSAPAKANPIQRFSMPLGHGKKVSSIPSVGANATGDDLAFKPSHFPRQDTELSLPDDGFCRLETEQCWPAWPETKAPTASVAGSGGIHLDLPNVDSSACVQEMPQQPVEITAWQYMWMLNNANNFGQGMPTSFDVPTQHVRAKPARRRRQMAPRPPSLIDMAAMEQQLPVRQVQPKNSKAKNIRNRKHVSSKNFSHEQAGASASTSQAPSFCPFCGGKAMPQFKFCQFCGADVASVRS